MRRPKHLRVRSQGITQFDPPRAEARGYNGQKPRPGSLALAERGFNRT
jgi:hypothetical protein